MVCSHQDRGGRELENLPAKLRGLSSRVSCHVSVGSPSLWRVKKGWKGKLWLLNMA